MAFYHMQMQQENIDTGQYQVTVSDRLNNRPIENARVRISYTGAPDSTIEEVTTDSSGRTPVIELKTPPLEYSMEPVEQQPYSEYTIQIEAEGFEPKEIAGSQVLADTLSRQPTTLNVMESGETFQRIVIPPHTLFYEYPPKIEEAEIKPINENGEIVLSKVVVPEYIVVHDGPVNDSAAGNYYVRYKDYIKNVASSEIYATWPDDTIRANVLAIMSFTLNRVYTEWYRNKGYDFTITSSTAYDHKWIYGRNIFASIHLISDETKEEIKNELFLLADELEELAINGKTADGNRVRIYVSNINFEATYSYVDTNNLQMSLIRIYSINSITTMDNEIFCTLKEWIQSLKKFSTLISESGEMQRIQFFKQQREIIDAL